MGYLFDSTYYSSIIPRDNLWSEWTFDQYYNNGTVLLDTSGNNRHCTLTGISKIVHDVNKGKCFYFDGTNYFITTDTHTIGSTASVSLWIKNILTTQNGGMPYSFKSTAYSYGVDLYWYSGGLANNTADGAAGLFANSSAIFTSSSKWWHVVVLYNGTTSASLYVDNVFIGNAALAKNIAMTTAANFYISSYSNAGNNLWQGPIKNFRIYEKLLTTEEIGLLYNEGMNPMVNK